MAHQRPPPRNRPNLFQVIKSHVTIDSILAHYNISVPDETRARRAKVRIPCPIHGGTDPNFELNLERDRWTCYSECAAADPRTAAGDVVDLVARLDSCSLWEAAQTIADWFELDRVPHRPPPEPLAPHLHTVRCPPHTRPHPALERLHVSWDAAEKYDIGFCVVGRFAGRVTWPLHDPDGRVVGTMGRVDTLYAPQTVFSGSTEKYLISRRCPTGRLVYGLHHVHIDEVIVVEGPRDVWALSDVGFPAVATLGAHATKAQLELIRARGFRRIYVMYDGDDAGRRAAAALACELQDSIPVTMISIPDGEDPASMVEGDPDHVIALLAGAGFVEGRPLQLMRNDHD